jgi:hypothetical protein
MGLHRVCFSGITHPAKATSLPLIPWRVALISRPSCPVTARSGGRQVIDTYRDFFADMYVASLDNEKKSKILAKYKDWKQIPIFMSADATISYIKGENKK